MAVIAFGLKQVSTGINLRVAIDVWRYVLAVIGVDGVTTGLFKNLKREDFDVQAPGIGPLKAIRDIVCAGRFSQLNRLVNNTGVDQRAIGGEPDDVT